MLIGLMSDSHDHMTHIDKAVTHFKKYGVERLFHLGDYVNPGSVKRLDGLQVDGVLGNNDGEIQGLLRHFKAIGGTLHGDFCDITLDGVRFALYHGTEQALTNALIKSETYSVVVSGHTHQIMERQTGDTLALNPGTAHGFGKEPTVMIFDTTTHQAKSLVL